MTLQGYLSPLILCTYFIFNEFYLIQKKKKCCKELMLQAEK
jgi:hypothetical protein